MKKILIGTCFILLNGCIWTSKCNDVLGNESTLELKIINNNFQLESNNKFSAMSDKN